MTHHMKATCSRTMSAKTLLAATQSVVAIVVAIRVAIRLRAMDTLHELDYEASSSLERGALLQFLQNS